MYQRNWDISSLYPWLKVFLLPQQTNLTGFPKQGGFRDDSGWDARDRERSAASWSRQRRRRRRRRIYARRYFSARLRAGNDFTGRCRGFGSVTDPHRCSWEAVVKVYTVTKGRCHAANIRSVGRNVLSEHHTEPEALATRLSFRITTMDSKLFQGLCSSIFFPSPRCFSFLFLITFSQRTSFFGHFSSFLKENLATRSKWFIVSDFKQ